MSVDHSTNYSKYAGKGNRSCGVAFPQLEHTKVPRARYIGIPEEMQRRDFPPVSKANLVGASQKSCMAGFTQASGHE